MVIDLPLSDTYFVVAHFHLVMGVSPYWSYLQRFITGIQKLADGCTTRRWQRSTFGLPSLALTRSIFRCTTSGFGSAETILCARQYGLHPTVCSRSEFLNHDRSANCGSSQILFFINIIGSLKWGKKADPNPWGAASLNGKRLILRQCTATGVRTFLLCTDGPMTTASPEPRKTLSRRMCRKAMWLLRKTRSHLKATTSNGKTTWA